MDENGLKGLEEERRLAYVGLTRARKIAYVSHAANRRVHNQWQNALPSRFLSELPKENVERRDDQTFHRGQSRMFNTGLSEGRWSGASYMQRTARRAPPTIDATAVVTADSPGRYDRGARVFHQKFGYGAVVSAEGDKLEIEFDKAGRKKVMAGFVVPAHEAG
jgi:DNA helicase-2/ATP-dependent DNA helicase PcrA